MLFIHAVVYWEEPAGGVMSDWGCYCVRIENINMGLGITVTVTFHAEEVLKSVTRILGSGIGHV